METMIKDFQTYLMRTTTKLVQSLRSNKQHTSNNITILLQVYDEATNSVARSNTSHNNSPQAQSHSENRPNSFSEHQYPFHQS